MTIYYKIYHYSSQENLSSIDPKYYGKGVARGAECKYAKTGLDKTYFYVVDEPESKVSSGAKRYEIYLPGDWKNLIYDIGNDSKEFRQDCKNKIKQENKCPYDYLVWEYYEAKIKNEDYKGWCNSNSPLPHVITLFYPITTHKPAEASTIHDWNGNILEVISPLSPCSLNSNKTDITNGCRSVLFPSGKSTVEINQSAFGITQVTNAETTLAANDLRYRQLSTN